MPRSLIKSIVVGSDILPDEGDDFAVDFGGVIFAKMEAGKL